MHLLNQKALLAVWIFWQISRISERFNISGAKANSSQYYRIPSEVSQLPSVCHICWYWYWDYFPIKLTVHSSVFQSPGQQIVRWYHCLTILFQSVSHALHTFHLFVLVFHFWLPQNLLLVLVGCVSVLNIYCISYLNIITCFHLLLYFVDIPYFAGKGNVSQTRKFKLSRKLSKIIFIRMDIKKHRHFSFLPSHFQKMISFSQALTNYTLNVQKYTLKGFRAMKLY